MAWPARQECCQLLTFLYRLLPLVPLTCSWARHPACDSCCTGFRNGMLNELLCPACSTVKRTEQLHPTNTRCILASPSHPPTHISSPSVPLPPCMTSVTSSPARSAAALATRSV